MAAPEPQQRRLHAAGIEKEIWHVEQPDHSFRRTQTTGCRDAAIGVKPNWHGDFYQVGFLLERRIVEPDQDLAISGIADLLPAFISLHRPRLYQAAGFQR